MKPIKLSAIDSTNDFLKELAKNGSLENFTTVIADEQTKGRGQMGATWSSEKGKNLIMSILIKDVLSQPQQVFDLNIAVSLSIIQVLEVLKIPDLAIKWPNDILSDDKKIAGILIENRFRSGNSIESVVGIGLNVNQRDFAALPQASSLALIAQGEFDIAAISEQLTVTIQRNCHSIITGNAGRLWQDYLAKLFRKDLLMSFENAENEVFSGTITGVTKEGQLEVMLPEQRIQTFGIKEVRLLY